MSEGTAGSKLSPRRSKRMVSPQTMGSGKKKKLAESSTKATVISETGPEYSTSRCNSHFRTRKKMHKFWKDSIIFNTNRSSYTVVKALLTHKMAAYLNSKSHGHFSMLHIYWSHWIALLVAKAVYETLSSVLSLPINNLCQLYNVWTKYADLQYVVYGFYFTQCFCTESIECSQLSLNIYIMYSCFNPLAFLSVTHGLVNITSASVGWMVGVVGATKWQVPQVSKAWHCQMSSSKVILCSDFPRMMPN